MSSSLSLKLLLFNDFEGCYHPTVSNRQHLHDILWEIICNVILIAWDLFQFWMISFYNNPPRHTLCWNFIIQKIEVISIDFKIKSLNHSFKCFHWFDYSQQLFLTDGVIELRGVQFVHIKAKRSSWLYQCCT